MKKPSPLLCLLFPVSLIAATGPRSANESVYSEIVAPILDAKCVQCHGEEKQKGKMRLDSFEAVMKGGTESGDTNVVAGDPKKSYMIERLHLPADDDEHMPPEDEEQLTKGETRLLEWWIETGAKADLDIAAAKPSAEIQGIIDEFNKNKPKRAVAKAEPTAEEKKAMEEQAKAAAAVMEKINATGATLMPISAESDTELRFTALNVAKEFGDEQLAALQPVAELILWLDVAGTKVTDKGLAGVAAMKKLKRLYLQNTAVTDAGLDHLKGLGDLEYLNLYGSPISDAGLAKLGGLKNLKSLYLWQTKVTPAAATAFEKQLGGVKVNVGWTDADKAVVVAAAAPPKPAAEAKADPAKPAATTTPGKAAAKTDPAKPAAAKPESAKPAATPAPPKAPEPIQKAKEIADAEVALAKVKADAAAAAKAAADAKAKADAAAKAAAELQKKLDELKKAVK